MNSVTNLWPQEHCALVNYYVLRSVSSIRSRFLCPLRMITKVLCLYSAWNNILQYFSQKNCAKYHLSLLFVMIKKITEQKKKKRSGENCKSWCWMFLCSCIHLFIPSNGTYARLSLLKVLEGLKRGKKGKHLDESSRFQKGAV